ncbi:MAG: hypothetical protein EXQ94_09240 [Alphaproteobacteria bacterium]|nr:hypothetical protein [Alphaproteobacteria bacterium]
MQRALADETLVAYVDGELDPVTRRAVESGLKSDPDAALKVATMRHSADALRGAFDEVMSEPIPERLRAVIDRAVPSPNGQDSLFDLATRWLMAVATPRQFAFAGAIGAVALVAGLGIGQLEVGSEDAYVPAGIARSSGDAFAEAVARAMEAGVEGATASYERADIGVRGTVTALGQVALASGITCRAFRDEQHSGGMAIPGRGIACRGADGVWANLVVSELTSP